MNYEDVYFMYVPCMHSKTAFGIWTCGPDSLEYNNAMGGVKHSHHEYISYYVIVRGSCAVSQKDTDFDL